MGILKRKAGPRRLSRRKSGRLFLQMLQHPPEQLLGHLGRTLPVGVGKAVAAGRGGPANGGQRPGMQLQRIAQVIEPDAMSQLGIQAG